MYRIPAQCPVCKGELHVERLACEQCGTALEGMFHLQRFSQLTETQWGFVETFLRCEGKLNRVQEELGISYPTARGRLHDVIHALGYEVGEGAPEDARRDELLNDLAEGKSTVEQVLQFLLKQS